MFTFKGEMGIMTIKEAAKKLHVEAHVLRYWEDELKLDIKRNAQGHRYYDDRDIRLFESVKAMKEEGLMLKDIRNAIIRAKRAKAGETASDLPEGQSEEKAQTDECAKITQEEADNEDKSCKPEANMKHTSSVELRPVHTRMDEDKDSMLERMQKMVGDEDKVVDFKQAQLQSVMNRVIATALRENKDIITTSIKEEVTADVMRQFDAVMREKEEREEARYRRLDTVLREIQQANAEVAATKTKKGIFKKH